MNTQVALFLAWFHCNRNYFKDFSRVPLKRLLHNKDFIFAKSLFTHLVSIQKMKRNLALPSFAVHYRIFSNSIARISDSLRLYYDSVNSLVCFICLLIFIFSQLNSSSICFINFIFWRTTWMNSIMLSVPRIIKPRNRIFGRS